MNLKEDIVLLKILFAHTDIYTEYVRSFLIISDLVLPFWPYVTVVP